MKHSFKSKNCRESHTGKKQEEPCQDTKKSTDKNYRQKENITFNKGKATNIIQVNSHKLIS